MPEPEYPHEIEYRREGEGGRHEHVYTERVDDMGFCLEHHRGRLEAWLAHYTRACAEDYLGRVLARRGTWFVSAYRLRDGDRKHLVTVRIGWPPKKTSGSPVGETGRRTTMRV